MPNTAGATADATAILLCRSAILQITRGSRGFSWDSTESLFPSNAIIARKVKKQCIFRILHYLLERNFEERRNTSWRHISFTKLRIPLNTAHEYHTEYRLRKVASQHVRRVDKCVEWVREQLNGRVLHLDQSLKDEMIPVIAERGRVCSGYVWVDPQSVGRDARFTPKRIQYRKIDPAFINKDVGAAKALQSFVPHVASAISVAPQDIELKGSYLKSLGYAPQEAHQDFESTVLSEYREQLYLALTPLTESGCYLQVWLPNHSGSCGKILYIPYGVLLILPGDTVHGGGFLADYQSLDLRLHFYIYVKPAKDVINKNFYFSIEKFPMNQELDPDGLLDRLFSADEA